MTIVVTQPDNEYASRSVQVKADGNCVGSIGPGESILVKAEHSPCNIEVVCGSYSASIMMNQDGEAVIRWSLNTPLELIPGKLKQL